MSAATTYDDVEHVLAEIITEATGEPRIGRFERASAKAALSRLRAVGLSLSSPPANDVREALDADVTKPRPIPWMQVWDGLVEFSEAYRRERGYSPNEAARTDFLFSRFEVRLRGTVAEADAPRSPEHVVRICADCGHDPHGVGMICWHEHCPCRGNGGRS